MIESSDINILGFAFILPAYAKQIFLSGVIGFLIGFERLLRGKAASLRTFSTICIGSCVFTLISIFTVADPHIFEQMGHEFPQYDLSRISAQIVSGIGFLGGGVIFKTQDRIEGITTAAMIWLTAALGVAIGFNQMGIMWVAFICFLFIYVVSRIIDSLWADGEPR